MRRAGETCLRNYLPSKACLTNEIDSITCYTMLCYYVCSLFVSATSSIINNTLKI